MDMRVELSHTPLRWVCPAARAARRRTMPAHESAATANRRDQARRLPRDGKRVKLYSRPGNDLTYRFPLIVEALKRLRSRSCIIDGEAVCCDDEAVALIRHAAEGDKVTTFTSTNVVQLRFLSPRWVLQKRDPPKPSPTLRSPG
jgi:ATP dependent DNA ligase domain